MYFRIFIRILKKLANLAIFISLPWTNVIKLSTTTCKFSPNMKFLFLATLSNQVKCLWVRPSAYPRGELLLGTPLGQVPALLANIRLKRLARDKHSSLLGTLVKYGNNFFKHLPLLAQWQNLELNLKIKSSDPATGIKREKMGKKVCPFQLCSMAQWQNT